MSLNFASASLTGQSLTPPQQFVLNAGLLASSFNCVLQMPTGSGKTWLAEHAIAATLDRGCRAVYLAPLRALAAELHAKWQARFGSSRVGVFTGDSGAQGRQHFAESRLLVMTPERLDACTRAWRHHWHWIPEVDLLVVDELHLLGERERGARLEGTISRFRRLNPFAQVLGLSATLGNRRELAAWLDGIEHASTWRPVPLRWRTVAFRKATEKPELAAREIQTTVRHGGRSLVFVQSRRKAEELATYLNSVGIVAAHHHAGLDQASRRSVESRLQTGALHAVVATSTVEMGVNLPVRQVVLYDLQQFDGQEFRPLPVNSVWQRVGRAGRPGLDSEGEGVLLHPSWDRSAVTYQRAAFDPIRSQFTDPRCLAEQVVAEVGAGLVRTRGQLARVLRDSLAQRQGVTLRVDAVVDEMLAAGMLRERACDRATATAGSQRPTLSPTRLGRVVVRHLMAPSSVLAFRGVLQASSALTFFDLLVCVSVVPDAEPVLPVGFEELDTLQAQLLLEKSVLLARGSSSPLMEVAGSGKRLLSALRMALVLRDWTRSGSAAEVAEHHNCYPFEVRRLVENAVRLLMAFSSVARVVCADGHDAENRAESHGGHEEAGIVDRISALARMLESGLDEVAASLLTIQGIGPTIARRLVEAGVQDIEDLANANADTLAPLVRGVSAPRLARWIDAAQANIKRASAYHFVERETNSLQTTVRRRPTDVDPYRLRRALDLTVTPLAETVWQVTGGLEPHRVTHGRADHACDCVDAARGHQCKHVLAVRLAQGDAELAALVGLLDQPDGGDLDLTALWMNGSLGRGGRAA